MDKYRYGLRKHKRSNQTTPSVEEMTRHLLRRIRLSLAMCLTACVTAMVGCSDNVSAPTPSAAVRSAQSKTDATEYEVTDLGSFGIGATISFAIDKQGTVLGRYTRADGAFRSFRRTEKDGYEDLGDFEGRAFQILNTNDRGLLNGNVSVGPGVQRAVAWVPKEGFTYLDGTNTGSTLGSNDRGAIAGTRTEIGKSSAFVWTEEAGVQLIPVLIAGRTIVNSTGADLNNDGTFAGTVVSRPVGGGPTFNRAFVYDATGATTLIPPLGPTNVGVTSISDEGLVVGASETRAPLPGERRASPLASSPGDVPVHAWKWSQSLGLVDLGTLGGKHSVAWDSDKDGNVYGWSSDAANRRHAVKWSIDGSVVDLGSLGGDTFIGGLNKHGVLTGWSVAPDGVAHAALFEPNK